MTPEEIMQHNHKGLVKCKKSGKSGYVCRVSTSSPHGPDSPASSNEKSKEYSYWVVWCGNETPELVKGDDLIL